MNRFTSNKIRKSTKDKFVSILKNGGYPAEEHIPWYKRANNFYPLLMIIVFTFLYMAAKAISEINVKWEQQAAEEQPLDYETAREIFNSSGREPSDTPDQE